MSQPDETTSHILIVDDDTRIRNLLRKYLSDNGYRASTAADAADARAQMGLLSFDLLVLDVMMPGLTGLEFAEKLRKAQNNVPILLLTARADVEDRIAGLAVGADDYLPKPFEPRELLARLRAVLRRGPAVGVVVDEAATSVHRYGSLCIDLDARQVHVSGEACELTAYQFDLLVALAQRAGRVLSRDQIMGLSRGKELDEFDRSIDVHIGRIRQAIESDVKHPKRILTVRGVGYVFAKQQD